MERLKPLLRKIDRNIDRIAIVVFLFLTATVIFLWNYEKTSDPDEPPGQPARAELDEKLPNEHYTKVIRDIAWDGDLYQARPINEEHPYYDLIRFNDFTRLEATTDQEIRERVEGMLSEAQTLYDSTEDMSDLPLRLERLERAQRLCEQIIQVWSAQSGVAQGGARQLLEQVVADIEAVNTALGETDQ